MENIPWQSFSVATAGWLLFAIVSTTALRLIMSGKLVPRTTLDDALHDRDEWRAESRIKDQQIATKDQQLDTKDRQLAHLSEVGETQKAVLLALGQLADRDQ